MAVWEGEGVGGLGGVVGGLVAGLGWVDGVDGGVRVTGTGGVDGGSCG